MEQIDIFLSIMHFVEELWILPVISTKWDGLLKHKKIVHLWRSRYEERWLPSFKTTVEWREEFLDRLRKQKVIHSSEPVFRRQEDKRNHFGVWSFGVREDTLVMAGGGRNVTVWNMSKPKLKFMYSLAGHKRDVRSSVILCQDRCVVTGSEDSTIKVWNGPTCFQTIQGHRDVVSSIGHICTNYEMVASGSWDRTLKIWNIETGQLVREWNEHGCAVTSISSWDNVIVSGDRGGTVRIWDIRDRWKHKIIFSTEEVTDLFVNKHCDCALQWISSFVVSQWEKRVYYI